MVPLFTRQVEAMAHVYLSHIIAIFRHSSESIAQEFLLECIRLKDGADVLHHFFILIFEIWVVRIYSVQRFRIRWVFVRGCEVDSDTEVDVPS